MNDNHARLMRRRNGRPAACAPCHARKVACDHTRPVCKRCEKRKHPDECRYPAPTSTTVSSWAASPSPGPRSSESSPLQTVRQAYFGYTSHNMVFEETENALALLGNRPACLQPSTPDETPTRGLFRNLPVPLREAGWIVLRSLPGQVNGRFAYKGPIKGPQGWSHHATEQILELLQGVTDLDALGEMLCRNSSKALHDKIDPREWMAQFTGKNIRWESIGLVWTYAVGIGDIMAARQTRCIEWEGGESLKMAAECLGYCIDLARHFTDANDILLDLCRRRVIAATFLEGDASLSAYTHHAVSVQMLTYLGFHAMEDSAYVPSICSENQRQLLYRIFGNDTMGVAFTGRPPAMTRRFISTPLPLDIPEEVLAGDPGELIRYAATLDEHGWNTKGELNSATVLRARVIVALVRDGIIEIAVGKGMFVTLEQLEAIKTRALGTMAHWPRHIVYDPDSKADQWVQYTRVVLRLDHLQNVFFVERLLLRHGKPDTGDLLSVSFDMVCLTLKLWTNKDRFPHPEMFRNFDWLLMAYGAPGGGILCQELLYPKFVAAHPNHSRLTRSSLVQQLSLLVGFLDWVRPDAPNAQLCCDAKKVVERVLDHQLNGHQVNHDWGVMAQPDFNFDLLDTFEWLREV